VTLKILCILDLQLLDDAKVPLSMRDDGTSLTERTDLFDNQFPLPPDSSLMIRS
jgi:hypothetical protein